MHISVVSPIYKGEKMLDELVERITAAVRPITDDYEIILVNDQSPDRSWERIEVLCSADPHVKGIDLSRNFGQHYAITAGLSRASGEWVVVMDCDLQDRPEEIPNLYRKAQEGWDSVFAQRVERQDKFLKRLSSAAFHWVFDYLTGQKSDKTIANFGIYHRKVIDAVIAMGDSIRNVGVMIQWVGFRRTSIPVAHSGRAEGTSGYNFLKLMRLATDSMIGFSEKPLMLMLKFGFYIVLFSVLISIYFIVRYFMGGISVDGFTSLIVSSWLIGGMIIMMLGVVGLYVGKIFDRVKDRPIYIVAREINFDHHTEKEKEA